MRLRSLLQNFTTSWQSEIRARYDFLQSEKLQIQLLRLTVGKGNRAAVENAIGSTRAAVEVLTERSGKQPE